MQNLTNLPKKKNIQDYNKARIEIIEKYKNINGLISIYEYGSVSAPGISDLDIILVFSNRLKRKKIKIMSDSKFLSFFLKNGTIIKTTEKIFKKFNYIDQFNLKKIYGKKIELIKISNKRKKILSLISILDWLPERLLRLAKINASRNIKVNELLCLLYSVTYSFKKLYNITKIKNSFAKKNIQEINSLRLNWFKKKKRIVYLKKILYKTYFQIIHQLLNYEVYLEKNKIFSPKSHVVKNDQIILKIFKKSKIIFEEVDNKEDLLKKNLLAFSKKKTLIYMPIIFFTHFNSFLLISGKIKKSFSSKIKKGKKFNFGINNDYKKALLYKIDLMEKNLEFLNNHNFKNGLIRYGFYNDKR